MADVNYKIKIENNTFILHAVWQGSVGHIKRHAHSMSSYELHYIVSGKGHVFIDNDKIPLEKNMFYITGPNIFHEQIADPSDPMIELGIYFTISSISKYKGENPESLLTDTIIKYPNWISEISPQLIYTLKQLHTEVQISNIGHETLIPALFTQVLVQLCRLYLQDQTLTSHKISFPGHDTTFLKLERILLEDYSKLSIHDIANQLHISTRQLQRIFKTKYGETYINIQTKYRIELACNYLTTTNYTISYIAELLGFSSTEYFTSTFHKIMNQSPSFYRKSKA